MQEMRVRSLIWEGPLEKEMAACSSILAWRRTWTVQSMGSPGVGLELSDFHVPFKCSWGQHLCLCSLAI